MPRQKLSEYRAKCLISKSLGLPYQGWAVDASQPLAPQLETIGKESKGPFVAKVDEGVKGRFKKGLVLLNVTHSDLASAVEQLVGKGYRGLIVEPMTEHPQTEERYLSLVSDREGTVLQYTTHGGVDIEQHAGSIKKTRLDEETDWEQLAHSTGIKAPLLQDLAKTFTDNYFVFLEINPYVVHNGTPHILDAAVEVDDAAAFFVDSWAADDFRRYTGHVSSPQESLYRS